MSEKTRRLPLSEIVKKSNRKSLFAKAVSGRPLSHRSQHTPISQLVSHAVRSSQLEPQQKPQERVDFSKVHRDILHAAKEEEHREEPTSFAVYHDALEEAEPQQMPKLLDVSPTGSTLVSQLVSHVQKINVWYNATNFTHFPEGLRTKGLKICEIRHLSPYACFATLEDDRQVMLAGFKDQLKTVTELREGDSVLLGPNAIKAKGFTLYYQWQRIR